MQTSVGRGRCEGNGEKGAHEQAMAMACGARRTRGRREVVLDAVNDARSLCSDATLRGVGAEEPTEVKLMMKSALNQQQRVGGRL